MRSFLVLIFVAFYQLYVFADCKLNNANDVLREVSEKHPKNVLNQLSLKKAEAFKLQAGQMPNPQIEFESSLGNSNDGDSYKSTFRIQHIVELGKKRAHRLNFSENYIAEEKLRTEIDSQHIVIESVVQLHRLRQITEMIPIYEESLETFNKILERIRRSHSLSPEQMVESETLDLVVNDYSLKISQLNLEKLELIRNIEFNMGGECHFDLSLIPRKIEFEKYSFPPTSSPGNALQKHAKAKLDLAYSRYELEKAKAYPDSI
tara:strand:- start:37 stop:822 length:786 start_codon:yes stop_codon:yes gene_type:complete